MKHILILCLVAVTGCSTLIKEKDYQAKSRKEKQAFERAVKGIPLSYVQRDFWSYSAVELAWGGIIKDVQFKESERTILVAFEVEYRDFDWVDYGGLKPYRLSGAGGGLFMAGWKVPKPARISYLKTLAKPGDMILVYGTPYLMSEDGVVQLKATAVRPIPVHDFLLLSEDVSEAPVESDGEPTEAQAEKEEELSEGLGVRE